MWFASVRGKFVMQPSYSSPKRGIQIFTINIMLKHTMFELPQNGEGYLSSHNCTKIFNYMFEGSYDLIFDVGCLLKGTKNYLWWLAASSFILSWSLA